eukprot:2212143-Prymnesium_polylepis.1
MATWPCRPPCVAYVPCHASQASIKVPLELLELAEAQPPQASQSEIASEMIKVCSQAPAERFKIIEQVTADCAPRAALPRVLFCAARAALP